MELKSAGFPESEKIREKYFPRESQGISIFFVESQGKSGDVYLTQVNQILSYISRHIFVKPYVCRFKMFPRSAWILMPYLSESCCDLSGKERENNCKMSRKIREFKSSWLLGTLRLSKEKKREIVGGYWKVVVRILWKKGDFMLLYYIKGTVNIHKQMYTLSQRPITELKWKQCILVILLLLSNVSCIQGVYKVKRLLK